MKHKKLIFTGLLILVVLFQSTFAVFANNICLNVNNAELNLNNIPFMKDNVIMVPIREFAEHFDYKVNWIESSNSIELFRGNNEAALKIGDSEAIINNKKVELPSEIIVISGVTYISVNFFKELIDMNIVWDYDKYTLGIYSEKEYVYNFGLSGGTVSNNKTTAVAKGELIVNGGFEDSNGSSELVPFDATMDSNNRAMPSKGTFGCSFYGDKKAYVTSDEAHSGKYSLCLSGTNQGFTVVPLDNITDSDVGTYTLSYYYKTTGSVTLSNIITVSEKYTEGILHQDWLNKNASNDWQKVSLEISIKSNGDGTYSYTGGKTINGAKYVRIAPYYYQGASDVKIYVDDVSFVKK